MSNYRHENPPAWIAFLAAWGIIMLSFVIAGEDNSESSEIGDRVYVEEAGNDGIIVAKGYLVRVNGQEHWVEVTE